MVWCLVKYRDSFTFTLQLSPHMSAMFVLLNIRLVLFMRSGMKIGLLIFI